MNQQSYKKRIVFIIFGVTLLPRSDMLIVNLFITGHILFPGREAIREGGVFIGVPHCTYFAAPIN